jgi:transcriptional regulator with XRE-family HTH domain
MGDRIARLRRAKSWNQSELGQRVGTTGGQISKYERSSYTPRADLLARLADALEVSADYLLTGRSPEQPRQDFRLRHLVEELELLPREQRDNLVGFLEALLSANRLLTRFRGEKKAAETPPQAPQKPKTPKTPRGRRRR